MPNTNIQDKINKSTGIEKSTEQTVLKESYILQEASEVKDGDGKLIIKNRAF